MTRPKKTEDLEYIRRGFDIREDLYADFRKAAIDAQMYPKDWLAEAIREKLDKTIHHKDCGTAYRGCHPTLCPKDQYEKTGKWRTLEQLEVQEKLQRKS